MKEFSKRYSMMDSDTLDKIYLLLKSKNTGLGDDNLFNTVRKFLYYYDSNIEMIYFPKNNWSYPIYLRKDNVFIYVSYG